MKAAFLIHGFLSDKNDFERLLPVIENRYDEVFIKDLPAHGKDRQKRQGVKLKDILNFVEQNFDRLKETYDTVDVYGYSMGGALASYLACTREVGKLILLAPAHKAPALFFPLSNLKFRRECRKEKKGATGFLGKKISCRADMKKDNKRAYRHFFRVMLPRFSPRNLHNFFKIIRYCNKHLKEIKIPALILYGRLDQLVPHSAIKKISGRCVDLKCVVYRDIGHLMLLSCAYETMINDITSFLDKN